MSRSKGAAKRLAARKRHAEAKRKGKVPETDVAERKDAESVVVQVSSEAVPESSPAASEAKPEAASEATPLLLKIEEVESLLQLSRSTLDRMAKRHEIPGRVKIGGQVRYHRETLESWLLQNVEG